MNIREMYIKNLARIQKNYFYEGNYKAAKKILDEMYNLNLAIYQSHLDKINYLEKTMNNSEKIIENHKKTLEVKERKKEAKNISKELSLILEKILEVNEKIN